MNFLNAEELLDITKKYNISISDAMIKREVEFLENDYKDTIKNMRKSFDIMQRSIESSLKNPTKSIGGLIGGEAAKIDKRARKGKTVCGSHMSKAISYAMGVLEVNASMGLIVAAPTAGSSGVIPGSLFSTKEEFDIPEDDVVKVLFNAAAIGYIITRNATVAGAEGGCQAEVGTASAMASSAITELMGGTPEQCLWAAGTAISNILGLVCDPIAGLVESPCQSRNAMGVANALISSEIALCGIEQKIPFDEIVSAMYEVGRNIPYKLRETSLGGISATPMGCKLKLDIFNN